MVHAWDSRSQRLSARALHLISRSMVQTMLLHINPNLNPIHIAEGAAHKISEHWAELLKQLPGYDLLHGKTLAARKRRFAELATPAVIELALLASALMLGQHAPATQARETNP